MKRHIMRCNSLRLRASIIAFRSTIAVLLKLMQPETRHRTQTGRIYSHKVKKKNSTRANMKTARHRRALPRQSARAAAKFATSVELEKGSQCALRLETRVEGSRAKGDRSDEWGIYTAGIALQLYSKQCTPPQPLYFGFGTSSL